MARDGLSVVEWCLTASALLFLSAVLCGLCEAVRHQNSVRSWRNASERERASQLIYLAFSSPPPHIGQESAFWPAFSSCDDPCQPQAQNQAVRRLPLFAAPKVPFVLRSIRCATDAKRERSLIHFGSGFLSLALTWVPVPFRCSAACVQAPSLAADVLQRTV